MISDNMRRNIYTADKEIFDKLKEFKSKDSIIIPYKARSTLSAIHNLKRIDRDIDFKFTSTNGILLNRNKEVNYNIYLRRKRGI